MAGIVFIRTTDLGRLREFYIGRVGMTEWLSQDGITILRHENMLIGFQQKDRADTDGLITFYFQTRQEVDKAYEEFLAEAHDPPRDRPEYRIYNFFASDPDGRMIEFQTFLHDLPQGPHPW